MDAWGIIRPTVAEAVIWRTVSREADAISDPLRALGYVLWRIDPIAIQDDLTAWMTSREWVENTVTRLKASGQRAAEIGMEAWQLIAEEMRVDDVDMFMAWAVQAAFDYVQAYSDNDDHGSSAAAERLGDWYYHIPIIERLAASADILAVLIRLERWGFHSSAEGAYLSLQKHLAQFCCEVPLDSELSVRELIALGAAPQRKGRELPEYYARFGEVSKESAMSFYRRVYGKTRYENRPFADEIRRQDRLLYNRLTTALARNKTAGRQPASMLDLFPLRESARGGALAWRIPADEDPHSAAEALERLRAKNREKMRAYRARKKGK